MFPVSVQGIVHGPGPVFEAGVAVGGAIGPFWSRYRFDRMGTYHPAFLARAFLSSAALAITVAIREPKPTS